MTSPLKVCCQATALYGPVQKARIFWDFLWSWSLHTHTETNTRRAGLRLQAARRWSHPALLLLAVAGPSVPMATHVVGSNPTAPRRTPPKQNTLPIHIGLATLILQTSMQNLNILAHFQMRLPYVLRIFLTRPVSAPCWRIKSPIYGHWRIQNLQGSWCDYGTPFTSYIAALSTIMHNKTITQDITNPLNTKKTTYTRKQHNQNDIHEEIKSRLHLDIFGTSFQDLL
jgi:hypothetical protein